MGQPEHEQRDPTLDSASGARISRRLDRESAAKRMAGLFLRSFVQRVDGQRIDFIRQRISQWASRNGFIRIGQR